MKTNTTKHISATTWVDSNEGIIITLAVDKVFNIYTYKSSPYTMKLANNLASGGSVILNGITHRLDDEDTVFHFQLEQLEYLLSKYNKITGAPAILARDTFGTRDKAKAYFESDSWKQAKKRYFKLNVLEVLVPTLAEAQEAILLDKAIKDARKYESRLNVIGLRELKIGREDLLKDLPNQSVTTAIAPSIEAQQKIGEYGPYITFNGNYASTQLAVLESRMVNAWYYNQPEFKVQSLDDQVTELETLREWFQGYKEVLLQYGMSDYLGQSNIEEVMARDAAKYERLEQLEIEVGAYLEDRVQEYEVSTTNWYNPEQVVDGVQDDFNVTVIRATEI